MLILQTSNSFGWLSIVGGVIGVLSALIAMIVSLSRTKFQADRIDTVEEEFNMRAKFTEDRLEKHINNTQIHRDAERDERRWSELKESINEFKANTRESLRSIEGKIDVIRKEH